MDDLEARRPGEEITMTSTQNVRETNAAKHAVALASFLEIVRSDPDFVHVRTHEQQSDIGLWLRPDGTDVPCLAVAMDCLGNWSVFTVDGFVLQYLHSEVL
jgi:hypothetical protein